jgi:hypothetical protein
MRHVISNGTFLARQIKTARSRFEQCDGHHDSLNQILEYLLTHEPERPSVYTDIKTFNSEYTAFMLKKNNVFCGIMNVVDIDILSNIMITLKHLLDTGLSAECQSDKVSIHYEIDHILHTNGYTCLMDLIHDYELMSMFHSLEDEYEEFWRREKQLVRQHSAWQSRVANVSSLIVAANDAADEAASSLNALLEDFDVYVSKKQGRQE